MYSTETLILCSIHLATSCKFGQALSEEWIFENGGWMDNMRLDGH